MKKTLYAVLVALLIASTFAGSAAFAHSNGDGDHDKNSEHSKGFVGAFAGFRAKFFNHAFERFDRQDKDKNDKDEQKNNDKDNQMATVGGAGKVTAVSGNTITVSKAFGSSDKTWTINTDGSTDFSLRNGNDASIGNVHVGDLITFKGTMTSRSDSNLSLNASSVRVWGDIDLTARAHATGTITSVNGDDKELTITTSDGQHITVNAADETMVKDEDGDRGVFADLETGMQVKVKGFWNSLKNVITAIKIKITS